MLLLGVSKVHLGCGIQRGHWQDIYAANPVGWEVWLVGHRLYPTEVEGGMEDGQDSSGQLPVEVAWSLGHAPASFDLCALLLGVSKVHLGCGIRRGH